MDPVKPATGIVTSVLFDEPEKTPWWSRLNRRAQYGGSPRMSGARFVAALAVILVLAPAAMSTHAMTSVGGSSTSSQSTTPTGIHVWGNQLLDGSGNTVHLTGVNRSGTEYACSQGWGIFDGPSDAASVQAMASWHVNIVRIPLNEDCWLGINGANAAYSGSNYINAIVNYVNLLHQYGMYAELSLMWGAPGNNLAHYQSGGPDEDHSPALWTSLAATFKNDASVILAPWGETITGWQCFMVTGCNNQATYSENGQNVGYQTAPMSQAVTLMRGAGYTGVISIPCIDYANQCANYNGSSWWATHPNDPLNNLIAEAHVYGDNACGSQNNGACVQAQYGDLAQHVPVIWGETGENYESNDCSSTNMQVLLPWADAHISGYETWTWDTWGNCGSLISGYNGTPANAYGRYIQSHYAALAGGGSPTPTPTAPPSPSPTPTRTPSTPTPTATSPPSPSPTATRIPVTPDPTATTPPSPTSTPAPPSPSPTPTSTPTSTPTATSTPLPTPTLDPPSTPTATPSGSLLNLYTNSVCSPFYDGTFSFSYRKPRDASTYTSAPYSYAIAFTAWGGVDFVSPGTIDTSKYTTIEWNLQPNGQPIKDFGVYFGSTSGWINEDVLSAANVTQSLGNGWLHVVVPVKAINPNNVPVHTIQLKNAQNYSLKTIHVDDVQLVP